ncbi:MAG: hypothetical protein K0M49_15950 [Arenimonas sp.]|nr:hypothetical protein [Rhizobium sp.]MBW8447112.1 hypothetical protein [Arenimonas sp.]
MSFERLTCENSEVPAAMRFGYRIVVLLLCLASIESAYIRDAFGQSSSANSNAAESVAQSDPIEDIPRPAAIPIRVVEDRADEERVKQRGEQTVIREWRDLDAQESMAASTEQLVNISWWQLSLSVAGTLVAAVGTGGLVYSLILNKKATDAAIAAVDAARDALGAERAWVMMVGQTAYSSPNAFTDTGLNEQIGIALRWRNDGRSPALNMKAHMQLSVTASSDTLPDLSPHDAKDGEQGSVLGPGSEVATGPVYIPRPLFDQLSRHEKALYVYGRVAYIDTFRQDVQRVTEGLYLVEINMVADAGYPRPHFSLAPRGHKHVAS